MDKKINLINNINKLEVIVRLICWMIKEVIEKDSCIDCLFDKKQYLKIYNNIYYHTVKKHKRPKITKTIINSNVNVKFNTEKEDLFIEF